MQQLEIPFRVHPRAIKELGERLVTDDFVAVSELIKNSYDAMASKVILRFGTDSTGDFIEVEDNGFGMSLEVITDVWTVLFTPYKKIESIRKKSTRKLSGEKGIGRLSSARLGKDLEVYTQEKGAPCYRLLLEWASLDNLDNPKQHQNFDLSDFGVVVQEEEHSPFAKSESGTIIRISNLRRNDWLTNKEVYERIITEVSRIRPPLKKFKGFEIKIEHPFNGGVPIAVGDTINDFLKIPHYLFSGKVDRFGRLTAELQVKKPNVNETKDFDEYIHGDKKNPIATDCGPFEFEFRVWDLDSDSVAEISNRFSIKKSYVREMIKDNRGVSLYRNEILVLPKTAGNDWLGLEQRRVSRVGDKISSANIIAYVEIDSDLNANIKDTADREALERNSASDQLVELLIKVIEILEVERKKYKITKVDTYSFSNLLDSEKVKEKISEIKHSLMAKQDSEIVLKSVEVLEQEMSKQKEEIAERLGYYSRLATVGTIASFMVHEVRNSSMAIDACNRDGRALLEKCDLTESKALSDRLDASDIALKSLDELAEAILPLAGSKFKRKPREVVSLSETVRKCLTANKSLLANNDITVNQKGLDHMLAVSAGELFITVQNLVQNSIYWIGKEKPKAGVISISAEPNSDGYLNITFEDNGTGIPNDRLDAIFVAGFSSKPDGSGMGLTVVGEICEKYKGSVAAGNSVKFGGAKFKLALPMGDS